MNISFAKQWFPGLGWLGTLNDIRAAARLTRGNFRAYGVGGLTQVKQAVAAQMSMAVGSHAGNR